MSDFTRPDERMAKAVDEAIEMEVFSGCVLAWKHLHTHAVPHGVAMRVLSQDGPRRATDSHVPALRLASRVSAQDLLAEPVLVQVVQCGSVRRSRHAELQLSACGKGTSFAAARTPR